MATTRIEKDLSKESELQVETRIIDFSAYHEVPEQLGLIGLGLTDKELREQVIPYIMAHREIELVQLSDNNLTDAGALALSRLNLQSLILEKNKITKFGAMAIARNTHFVNVNLNDNDIGDDGLKAFKDNTNVLSLHVRGNKITNEGLKYLRENQTLESLSLEENPITNAGTLYLSDIVSLKRVALGGTNITHEGFLYLRQDEDLEILTINDCVAIPSVNTMQELLDSLKIYDMENSGIILQTLALDKLRQILQAGSKYQAAVSNQALYIGDEYNAKRVLMAFLVLYMKALTDRVETGGYFSQPKKEKSPAAEFLFTLLTSDASLAEIDDELDKHPEFDAAFKDKGYWSDGTLTSLRDQIKFAKEPTYREAPAPKKGWFW